MEVEGKGGKGGKVKGKRSLEVEGKGCKAKGIGLSSLEVSCLEDSFCDVEVSCLEDSFCEVESWKVSSVFSKIESKNF